MKFYHEQLQDDILWYKGRLAEMQAMLQNKTLMNKAMIAWEVGQVFHEMYFQVTPKPDEVYVYALFKMNADMFQSLFDEVEEILEENGYILDVNAGWSIDGTSVYRYKKDNDYIDLKIASGVCSEILTGKMIPEKKKDCTFITV